MEDAYRGFEDRRNSGYDTSRDLRSPRTYGYGDYTSRQGQYSRGPLRSHLRCRDIMTRNVLTCYTTTPITEVARILRDEDIGALPVINSEGRLEGIVTDRDLIIKGLTSNADDAAIKAEDCMYTDLYMASKNDRVVDVIRRMGDHQVRRVPVVDSRNRLVGIIAMADLATQTSKDRELGEAFEEISRPASWIDRVARWLGF